MDLQIHEPREGEDISATVRQAVANGFETVVAAGGDGTVSAVANAMVGTPSRLGIIPLGTTNVLARELGIPLDLEEACALLCGPSTTATIDAMRVNTTNYFTQIGIGIDAVMIRDTPVEQKRRLGIVAYLWTWATRLIGFQPHRFSISADGQRRGRVPSRSCWPTAALGHVRAAVGVRRASGRRPHRGLHPSGSNVA